MDDYYIVDENSDNEDSNSSADLDDNNDLDPLEALFMDGQGSDSDSEDDFETEMEREREARMRHSSQRSREADDERERVHMLDADDGQCSSGQRRSAAAIHTGDDLLYDPDSDDLDQKWVDSKRAGHSLRVANSLEAVVHSNQPQHQPLHRKQPNSDAVLNCPGCMSLLSLDCQRHETYKTQYRAMFVFNCHINFDQPFEYKDRPKKSANRRRGRAPEAGEVSGDFVPAETAGPADLYYNVGCSVCKTQIAVYDQNEVFHFFNVLASFT